MAEHRQIAFECAATNPARTTVESRSHHTPVNTLNIEDPSSTRTPTSTHAAQGTRDTDEIVFLSAHGPRMHARTHPRTTTTRGLKSTLIRVDIPTGRQGEHGCWAGHTANSNGGRWCGTVRGPRVVCVWGATAPSASLKGKGAAFCGKGGGDLQSISSFHTHKPRHRHSCA